MNEKKTVTLTVEVTDAEAYRLALLLKRLTFDSYLDATTGGEDKDEAYAMIAAADKVRAALADAGFAPR